MSAPPLLIRESIFGQRSNVNEALDVPSTLSACPQCGAAIPAGWLHGVCPKCLLRPRAQRAEARAPKRIGDYEIIEEIARGGMGILYRAKQSRLNRVVALKVILKGEFASEQEIRRFQSEAEAAGALDHANILPVYEVGHDAAWHFFSMRLIEGGSLDAKLRSGGVNQREAARLMLNVARAVHHAHQHGILHRDLKPGNILLDSSGTPFVADFGLAKHLEKGSANATRSDVIIGTPGYMSPEQASGQAKRVTVASDIYSLGAVFYEMLTGRAPFSGSSTMELLRKVIEQEPEPPRRVNPDVARELEAICLKCLEKDPRHRYASAEDLAEDLQRYLNGERISADSTNVLRRVRRVLDQSRHDEEFQHWGTMLICFGAVILLGHTATFLLIRYNQPEITIWISRGVQLLIETYFFWKLRPHRLAPTSANERHLWSIWLGFMIAYVANVFACRALISHDLVDRGGAGPAYWNDLMVYPGSSILAGLAFFIMGGSHWGRCYEFGIAYFVLAVLMPLHLAWAPLEFGALSCFVLVVFGVHLKRMAKREGK